MRFLDCFRKKSLIESSKLVIDITDTDLKINDVTFKVPLPLASFRKALGKPDRVFRFKGGQNGYTWDNFGIYCCTNQNQTVFFFSVRTARDNTEDMEYIPKNLFSGTLTFSGKNWEEFMYQGVDIDGIYRDVVTEGLLIQSKYSDIEKTDSDGPCGAYVGVTIEFREVFEVLQ